MLNINSATYNELIDVKGIGEVSAKYIIEYREKNGDFTSIGQLKYVLGFGKAKANKMAKFLKVTDDEIVKFNTTLEFDFNSDDFIDRGIDLEKIIEAKLHFNTTDNEWLPRYHTKFLHKGADGLFRCEVEVILTV